MKKWIGKWIEHPACPEYRSPVFRKRFWAEDGSATYTLFISGLGFYSAMVNENPVTDALLQPAFSVYNKTVYYNVYDVSHLVHKGENELSVTLGNGWFHEPGEDCFDFEHAVWKSRPVLLAELYKDDALLVATDSSWEASCGKFLYNSVRFGVDYDAGAEEKPCGQAVIAKGPGGLLKEQTIPPIRIKAYLSPVSEKNHVFDFGVNTAGDTEIVFSGHAGDMVSIVYGERLDENGDIDQTLIKRHPTIPRNQIDTYRFAGNEEERFIPDFTYKGFRYVQIKGECTVHSIRARVFHTDVSEVGGFTCENPVIDGIMRACRHSTLCNLHHTITDCPHREKNGWTGDAHISCRQSLYHFDMKAVYEKYIGDLMDCQWPSGQLPCIAPTSVYGYNWQSGPTWDAALILMPWNLYLFTGDRTLLEAAYPAMKRYLSYTEAISENGICRSGLGDFLPHDGVPVCPDAMMLTGYVFEMAETVSKIAGILGYPSEAAEYRAMAERTHKALCREFSGNREDNISTLATALHFRMYDADDERAYLSKKLNDVVIAADYGLGTGIFSSIFALEELTESGYFGTAAAVCASEKFPSWGYMLANGDGALWEHWSGVRGSLNHHMRSAVGAWLYSAVAGIVPDECAPGFAHVILKPYFSETVGGFSAWHDTPHGRISVEYRNGNYSISLPKGVTGTLYWNGEKTEVSDVCSFAVTRKE